ncbi:MAG: aldehyde ferredoxin oxidoreductase family protein [Kiritimatiellae bacterium]|nr:aldehyde ferredoxin oxidoreductase family protein [Kiritimatiellia bacterium]
MFGHSGRILSVDLTAGRTWVDPVEARFARAFVGGNGFAVKLIADRAAADVDPLAAGNALAFAVGPLAGTPVWGSSRAHAAAISPQTGWFADSSFGGEFAEAQKRAGYDAICITGASDRPVYLAVTDGGVRIEPARDLWGLDTHATIERLRGKEGRGAVAACIGPAGENGVILANVICGGRRTGAAGRGGLGAVMGAKRLKAVVVHGSRQSEVADPGGLTDLLASKFQSLRVATDALRQIGTPVLVRRLAARGLLGTRNNTHETCGFADRISGETLKQEFFVRHAGCPGCPVVCGKKVRARGGALAGAEVKMPEYETIFALGSMLENGDLASIVNANGLCDRLGLDTISMGVTLAFVAECMERGFLSAADLGGTVSFAAGTELGALVEATGRGQGIGRYLGLGSERLADMFGGAARECLHTVKGLEMAGHSARGLKGLGLGYATSTRGGSHHDTRPTGLYRGLPDGSDVVSYNVRSQHFTAVGDSLVMCRFIMEQGFGLELNADIAQLLNSVTGWDTDAAELETVGERIYNLERLINVRRGVRRAHDTLPHRVMNEPIPDGPAAGSRCGREELDSMLDAYYRLRGWSEDGVPLQWKLAELGLAGAGAANGTGRCVAARGPARQPVQEPGLCVGR